ncbi:MAG: HEAT repeat domain-containing protein [Candidatus Obscuribacterales bacterium]|nr:HEAT repeat domain-containing protein [Candidatus Obscuribacterales bacterium]
MERETDKELPKSNNTDVQDAPEKDKANDNSKPSKDSKDTTDKGGPASSEKAASLMAQEAWTDRLKPFTSPQDKALADKVEQWRKLATQDSADVNSPLRKMQAYLPHVNGMITEGNSLKTEADPQVDTARFERVSKTITDYDRVQKEITQAQNTNDQASLERLSKEQAALKQRMESKEFRQDLDAATKDLNRSFNILREAQGMTFNSALATMVSAGMKIPYEVIPVELPKGVNGLVVSDSEFRSMVERGEFKLPERKLADNELPKASDFSDMDKLLRFNGAGGELIRRFSLEQQLLAAKDKVSKIDSTGEMAKNWFPDDVDKMTDQQIEKKLAQAAPWLNLYDRAEYYAEQHDRFRKMIDGQYSLPSWIGGLPQKWDASAIEKHRDLVSVDTDPETRKTIITIDMPKTLDRNDENKAKIRELEAWIAEARKPVDQVHEQLKNAGDDNSTYFWGDIKTEMEVDRDGNPIQQGWKDANGKLVFAEGDGRKYRYDATGQKQWVSSEEKLTETHLHMVNGRLEELKPGDPRTHINLMEFRTTAKEVTENGETFIEISQVSKLQYATWASYQGWGLVHDRKIMGGDVKAVQLKTATNIPEDKGVAGGRRDGKEGDYLVTLEDGRQQIIDKETFEKQYKEKEGKPGEFEEKPKRYKPDDWVVIYKTDSGVTQPTLMQAKDVPAFCASQKKWHWGGKAVVTAVDGLMVLSGIAELRAAMLGVQAASGAAKITFTQALGKSLLTRQGLTGGFHMALGVTGFAGQGIENIGPAGKAFMVGRSWAMIADLSYSAIGRPGQGLGFVPSVEQINGAGFFSRSLLKFNQAYSAKPIAEMVGMEKGAGFLRSASVGQVQGLAADVYFLGEIGMKQIPGLWNRYHGTDSQQVQQRQALARTNPQIFQADDKKIPSSFDKQTMLKVEAFKAGTEEAVRLPANDPKRLAFSKQLIETVKNENANAKDRMGAAFALVSLYADNKDGKLPEKLNAGDASIDRAKLHEFVDSQRYLQAQEVLKGYADGMSPHVSGELRTKLSELSETAKLASSDDAATRSAAVAQLVQRFQSRESSREEKMLAASALLMTRRHDNKGELDATVGGAEKVKAEALVEYLQKATWPSSADPLASNKDNPADKNPAHLRLFAGDMMLRLDTSKFTITDMNRLCLNIVNDKNEPSDPQEKERWLQLKMQAMTDKHGYRLGDLYELMKSRVEPEIMAMPAGSKEANEAKGRALAELAGTDSETIKATLESLRQHSDARVSRLASFMLYAAAAQSPSERTKALSALHDNQGALAWPDGTDAAAVAAAQNEWIKNYDKFLAEKSQVELPSEAGDQYDQASSEKLRAISELTVLNPGALTNPELQAQINGALLSLVNANNPAIAAQAHSELISRIKTQSSALQGLKPEQMTAALKELKDQTFGDGGIVDTLRDTTMDLLQDSASFSSYASRAENLDANIKDLEAKIAAASGKISENEKAEMEAKLGELKQAQLLTVYGPAELKQAFIKNLDNLLSLKPNPNLGGNLSPDRKAAFDALSRLTEARGDSPETFSPQLRAEAVRALAAQSFTQPGGFGAQHNQATLASATETLTKVLKTDPSPLVRLAAIETMAKIGSPKIGELSFEQLKVETHPEVSKRLRDIEFANRILDQQAQEYVDKFNKTKSDLLHSSTRNLSGAEDFIVNDPSLQVLDGYTLHQKALKDLLTKYEGFTGTLKFAWNGESGFNSDSAKFVENHINEMRRQMDNLGERAKTEPEALKALVYIALSNGRPLLKDNRAWGVEKATEKLRDISKTATPEQAKNILWAAETLLLNQPMMNATARQNVLDGLKELIAKPGKAGLTDSQATTLLTVALQHELRNTPAKDSPDYKQREKLQLDLLDTLSKYPGKESLPVLAAMAEDAKQSPRSTAEVIPAVREKARELFAKLSGEGPRLEHFSKVIDYQDSYERALQQIRENSLKRRNLDKYEGPENWFSKTEHYNLMDADKLGNAQREASKAVFPGPLPWLFTSQETIDRRANDAVKEVWHKLEKQFANLTDQAKLDGEAGREAREALASIILTQGQPLREDFRVWAMQEAAAAIRNNFKDRQPGSKDLVWAVQAALVQGQNMDPSTRFSLMTALDYAQKNGAIDRKTASIVLASALETEVKGMPSKSDRNYQYSVLNQQYAIDLLSLWENREAAPVLEGIAAHHPDETVRSRAKTTAEYLLWRSRETGRRNNGKPSSDLPNLTIR